MDEGEGGSSFGSSPYVVGGEGPDGQPHCRAERSNERSTRERGLAAMVAESLFHRTIGSREGESHPAHHDAGGSPDHRPLAQRRPPAGMQGVLGIPVGGDGVKRLGAGKLKDERIWRHPNHDAFDPSIELAGLSHGPDAHSPAHGHQGIGLSRERGCRTAEDRKDENPSHEDFRRGTSILSNGRCG